MQNTINDLKVRGLRTEIWANNDRWKVIDYDDMKEKSYEL